jgi:hypothetical protein
MKKLLFILLCAFSLQTASAQTAADTITTSDMPVAGDTLRYSTASPVDPNVAALIAATGPAQSWDFSYLVPIASSIDSYLTASQINAYLGLVMPTAFGYKVADSLSIPIPLAPITLYDLYTLFKNNNSSYRAEGFVASLAGIPTPFVYTTADHIYNFPEAYGKPQDSNQYSLTISIPATLTIQRNGYRLTRTLGYGTVKTPFYTTPQECILIQSETHEIDSVTIPALPFPIGFPQNNVEFKWLIKGEHYPAVDVMAPYPFSGTVTSITYRDVYHYFPPLSTQQLSSVKALEAYPVPAQSSVTISVPQAWQQYSIELYDMQSRLVQKLDNKNILNLSQLPAGNYLARVTSGNNIGLVRVAKQ